MNAQLHTFVLKVTLEPRQLKREGNDKLPLKYNLWPITSS